MPLSTEDFTSSCARTKIDPTLKVLSSLAISCGSLNVGGWMSFSAVAIPKMIREAQVPPQQNSPALLSEPCRTTTPASTGRGTAMLCFK